MPALACFVDAAAAVLPPPSGYALAGDSTLPPPLTFTTTTTTTDGVDDSDSGSNWSPSLSSKLFKIDGWGFPYFGVNNAGDIAVRPHGSATMSHQEIDLLKVVKKASDPKCCGGLGLQLPLVVRFPDVLKNRLESIQGAFDGAIQSQGYESHYQGVYPVKCNQDRFVVEDIVEFGSGFRFGLEAGSKPELLLAMSCLCKEEELDMVVEISNKLCIRPVIGVRAKLRTKHSGHFGSTSGDKGKFGLTTIQILRVVKKLEQLDMLDCLQLLHFHIGSQIPTTELLADGVGEAAQIYCELLRLGAQMRVLDIGGGLGIDYDGSKSSDSDISVAYGLEEYAAAVVHAVKYVCDRRNVKHPVICSESGRAIVSHHSVLIFEAIGASSNKAPSLSSIGLQYLGEGLSEEALADYQNISAATLRGEHEACLLYTDQFKKRCVEQFKQGTLGIEQLAAVDGLCDLITETIGAKDLVKKYHMNLSVFTSIPDFWSIDQLFPIVPIHRLDEKPTVRGILSDLTCDSDGKIDKFIGGESSLPLHELEGHSGGYYLGMFLGGAYEEALGGLHNLFGGPSVVRVLQSDGPHGFAVTRAVSGPSCADVLRVMQHEPQLMFETLKHRALEFCEQHDDDSVVNAAGLANSLARSFDNMPYLVSSSTCCLNALTNNDGFYYCSGDDFSAADSASVVTSVAGEDEHWNYCCA
ncbi:arginine decarboxylase [Trifolium repens]|nr:arginine decarboxylase [Trifolium repens]